MQALTRKYVDEFEKRMMKQYFKDNGFNKVIRLITVDDIYNVFCMLKKNTKFYKNLKFANLIDWYKSNDYKVV